MNDITQVRNCIREEIRNVDPSKKLFFSYLFSLRLYKEGLEFNPKDEWRYLSDAEFFNIVGETFEENPEFYMKNLYENVKKKLGKDIRKRWDSSFWKLVKSVRKDKKLAKLGESSNKLAKIEKSFCKLAEMDKYIFEKYCLNDGEQILLETRGSCHWGGAFGIGSLWVTNYRIILQGQIIQLEWKWKVDKSRIINLSQQQKCYGYIFPIKNLSKLIIKNNGVSYKVKLGKYTIKIRIRIPKEHINKIFEILSKHSK